MRNLEKKNLKFKSCKNLTKLLKIRKFHNWKFEKIKKMPAETLPNCETVVLQDELKFNEVDFIIA